MSHQRGFGVLKMFYQSASMPQPLAAAGRTWIEILSVADAAFDESAKTRLAPDILAVIGRDPEGGLEEHDDDDDWDNHQNSAC